MESPKSPESSPAARERESRWLSLFFALVVVGIWIPLLCTAPQILGNRLASWLGVRADPATVHLVRVTLNSAAVVAFMVLTKRAHLLVPERVRDLRVLLLFVPLMALNVFRGPFTDAGATFVVVTFAGTMLTGLWEELLFRGLIQERLAVAGPRLSLVITAVLFALIHANEGVLPVLIAFGIGLAFCVARRSVGIWPLIVIHGTIDFASDVFVRRWEPYATVGLCVVAAYAIGAGAVLLRGATEPRETIGDQSRSGARVACGGRNE